MNTILIVLSYVSIMLSQTKLCYLPVYWSCLKCFEMSIRKLIFSLLEMAWQRFEILYHLFVKKNKRPIANTNWRIERWQLDQLTKMLNSQMCHCVFSSLISFKQSCHDQKISNTYGHVYRLSELKLACFFFFFTQNIVYMMNAIRLS